MRPKISVIVAAYNEEKKLPRALNSLVNQTLGSELEIIVVDDGSNDNTWNICQQYQQHYSNIRTFHEENPEQGQAREYGISFARGEYIGFTDADDEATPNMFKSMCQFTMD